MLLDFGDKLLDIVLPGIVKVLPEHWRKQAAARMQDFNPFASIAANEDLLRALRLAWIEAALEIDAAVLKMTAQPEWQKGVAETHRFSVHAQEQLRQLRHQAFDRNVHPGRTPIDVHLNEVLIRVPDYVRGAAGLRPGEVLTSGFVSTLAALAGWPEQEVPSLYARIAVDGLPIEGSESNRDFGELVLAAFAEILKSPNRYPEAEVAFGVAMSGMARELAQATLAGIGGIDSKIDSLLLEIRDLLDRGEGLESLMQQMLAEGSRIGANALTQSNFTWPKAFPVDVYIDDVRRGFQGRRSVQNKVRAWLKGDPARFPRTSDSW